MNLLYSLTDLMHVYTLTAVLIFGSNIQLVTYITVITQGILKMNI